MRPWTQVPPQAGRRFVITGSNGGLGLETARILASRGAHIMMACRNLDKARIAARSLPGHDKGRVEVRQLDVGDLSSVRAFVGTLVEEGRPVDVLINNAGVLGVPHALSDEGIEMHFATNYLGHFALTTGLLPLLTDRVVMISSREHRSGRIDLADLGWQQRPYRPFAAYGDSKLACLLFMREMDRRLRAEGSPVRAVGAHPGATATGITSGTGHPVVTAVGHFGHALVGMPGWRGALCSVYAATMDVPGGGYVGPHGRTELWGWPAPARMSPKAEDRELAAALWKVSADLVNMPVIRGARH